MFDLDLGIDLGATTSRVYEPRRGVVVQQPTATAVGCGVRALNAAAVENSVRDLLHAVPRNRLRRPRVVLSVPCHTDADERQALAAATVRAGARAAITIEAPVAAGIGAGVEVGDDLPSLVVDVGGRWTEVAVLAAGGMQASASMPVGGLAVDRALVARIRGAHRLHITGSTAEDLKLALGSAVPLAQEGRAAVTGTDAVGRTRTVEVTSVDVRRWIREPVDAILATIADVLDRVERRVAADLLDSELVLTGGGALLRGLDQRVATVSGMRVRVARESALATVRGAGTCGPVTSSVGAEGLEPPTSAV